MKKKMLLVSFLLLFILSSSTASGQFTSSEIQQREEIEIFLSKAEIIKSQDIPVGVTKPIQLFLTFDGKEESACWKNVKGIQGGYLEGWQYEIAAYRMDKLLNLNMVPPTVERKFKEKNGSLQFWVETKYSYLDIMEQGIEFPASKVDHLEKMKYLTRAFDSLIANEDRTQENIRFTEDWCVILIDHSRSFRSLNKFTQKLMFGKDGIMGNMPFRSLPRAFVKKIKELSFETIKNAMGPYLKNNEINAILERKELLLNEIEQMIKENGEDKVLY